MNKYIILIIIGLVAQTIFFSGCSPEEKENQPATPEEPEKVLNVSPLALSFKAEGESKTIVVTSNTKWELTHKTQNELWCLPDKISGSGNATIQMTATRNTTEEIRTDIYILSIEGKELTINLSQEKADLRIPLLFSSSNAEFAAGDQIGIFMVNRPSGSDIPVSLNSLKGNQADNIKITKQTQAWTASEDIFWKNPTTVVDVYAYYPWRQTTQNDLPEGWQINVEKDQSNPTGLLTSSLPRYGQAVNQLPGEYGNLNLSFAPLTANLNIEIQLINGVEQVYQITKSKVLSVYVEGKLNLNTGQVQTAGIKSEINTSLGKNDEGSIISHFYMIPQRCEASQFLVITYMDKRYNEKMEIPITLEESTLFEGGQSYNYVIQLSKTTDRLILENVSISGWGKGEDIEFPFN